MLSITYHCSQLHYDDHKELAEACMKEWQQEGSPIAPSERLFHLVSLGLAHEHGLSLFVALLITASSQVILLQSFSVKV